MEKIRITTDDIARTDAPEPAPPPPPPTEIPLDPSLAAPRRLLPWLVAACGAAAIVILLGLAFFLAKPHEATLDEWKDAERQHLNAELAKSRKLKPSIEDIHPLVTFTGAALKSIAETTVDGSQPPENGGSNIAEVEFVVTYHWEGPVQKNGYTEVLSVMDKQANRLKTSRYVATSALINLDNIDWFQLGLELAPLFF